MNVATLGDVCRVTTGQSAPQDAEAFGSAGIPFVRAGSLERLCDGESENALELVPPEQAEKYRLKIFPKDTIVFAKSGMSAKVGRVHRLRRDCHVVSHLAAVLPSREVDSGYLRRWFEYSPPSRLIENNAYPSIKTSTLEKIKFPLPPLVEQRRIAAILDKADALRAKRRETIAKLDQLLQSVFIDMFGDPLENPKGWLVSSVGESCEKVTVGIVVKPASYYVERGVPALRSLNIGVNRIIENDFVYFSEADNSGPLKKTKLRKGDVVAVRSGQPGKAAVVPESLDGANAIDVLIARTDNRLMLPEFLAHFLNSPAGKRLVLAEQRGQVQKHLNVKQLAEAEVPLPPIALQREFLQAANSIEALRGQMGGSLSMADALLESIQRRAFAGSL